MEVYVEVHKIVVFTIYNTVFFFILGGGVDEVLVSCR